MASLRKTSSCIKKGFTLVELLITVAIMGVITTVVVTSHQQFDSTILLSNLAHDIALSVRQAQVYGISVRGDEAGSDFNAGYGIHFDLDLPDRYIFFADDTGNRIYTPGLDTILNQYSLSEGYRITALYSVDNNGNETSLGAGTDMDVVFVRPDPTAYFVVNNVLRNYPSVRIVVSSTSGSTRSVTVSQTGQISVGYE